MKKTIRVLLIIAVVFGAISILAGLVSFLNLPTDEEELAAAVMTAFQSLFGGISSIIMGSIALGKLAKATCKRDLTVTGVLCLLLCNTFGLIAGIMMLVIKEHEFMPGPNMYGPMNDPNNPYGNPYGAPYGNMQNPYGNVQNPYGNGTTPPPPPPPYGAPNTPPPYTQQPTYGVPFGQPAPTEPVPNPTPAEPAPTEPVSPTSDAAKEEAPSDDSAPQA